MFYKQSSEGACSDNQHKRRLTEPTYLCSTIVFPASLLHPHLSLLIIPISQPGGGCWGKRDLDSGQIPSSEPPPWTARQIHIFNTACISDYMQVWFLQTRIWQIAFLKALTHRSLTFILDATTSECIASKLSPNLQCTSD